MPVLRFTTDPMMVGRGALDTITGAARRGRNLGDAVLSVHRVVGSWPRLYCFDIAHATKSAYNRDEMGENMNTRFRTLWNRIQSELDAYDSHWRNSVEVMRQIAAVQARERGTAWSDDQVFEAVVKAVLSNSTDWSKIQRVEPELSDLFHRFDLAYYANLTPADIDNTIAPWFRTRKAGSMTQARDLKYLISTARILRERSHEHGSIEQYLRSLLEAESGDPIGLVRQLGFPGPQKLPGLGIPLAAETAKNLGFDVAKPDRHINRAVGCFGLLSFSSWKVRSKYGAPQASNNELLAVMRAMSLFAKGIGERVTFLDNSIWLLCAKSGAYLNNERLRTLPSP